MFGFKLRFKEKAIPEWAERNPVEYDAEIETVIAPQVKARGYFLQDELIRVCRWKTPRSQSKVARNTVAYIATITQTALSTASEQLRIEVLTLLNGARWPTASVVLHFCHADSYPILDVQALWSLGIDANTVPYNFEFWSENTLLGRGLAQETTVSDHFTGSKCSGGDRVW